MKDYELMKFFTRLVKLRGLLDENKKGLQGMPTELEDILDLIYYQIKEMEENGGLGEDVARFLENKKKLEESIGEITDEEIMEYLSSDYANNNDVKNKEVENIFDVIVDNDLIEISSKGSDKWRVQEVQKSQKKELFELWEDYKNLMECEEDDVGGSATYVLHGVSINGIVLINHGEGIKGWLASFREKYFRYVLNNFKFDDEDIMNYKYKGKNVFSKGNGDDKDIIKGIKMKNITSLSSLIQIIIDINDLIGLYDVKIIVDEL